jgi:hypothetical protein
VGPKKEKRDTRKKEKGEILGFRECFFSFLLKP